MLKISKNDVTNSFNTFNITLIPKANWSWENDRIYAKLLHSLLKSKLLNFSALEWTKENVSSQIFPRVLVRIAELEYFKDKEALSKFVNDLRMPFTMQKIIICFEDLEFLAKFSFELDDYKPIYSVLGIESIFEDVYRSIQISRVKSTKKPQ